MSRNGKYFTTVFGENINVPLGQKLKIQHGIKCYNFNHTILMGFSAGFSLGNIYGILISAFYEKGYLSNAGSGYANNNVGNIQLIKKIMK
jgi:hypothetical protein